MLQNATMMKLTPDNASNIERRAMFDEFD